MIKRVIWHKESGVTIRYENGQLRSYSHNKMPKTAMDFISREDVKAHENEAWITYQKEAQYV